MGFKKAKFPNRVCVCPPNRPFRQPVHGLSDHDARIAASALHADCDTPWSEDRLDGMTFGNRLRIVDPSRGGVTGADAAYRGIGRTDPRCREETSPSQTGSVSVVV
jgi:hypothetical protein